MVKLRTDDIIKSIGPHLSAAAGSRGGELRLVANLRENSLVDDANSIFLLALGDSRFVVRISPAAFPDIVEVEEQKSAVAKNYLGSKLGSVILQPVLQGRLCDRTYCVLPYHKGFSHARFRWAWQKRRYRPFVLKWLRDLVEHATTDGTTPEYFTSTLQGALTALLEIDLVPVGLKKETNEALERLATGKFRARSVLMHGDFWKGNLLRRPSRGAPFPFVVIDWRGSEVDGYPLLDLVTCAASFSLSDAKLRSEVENHCVMLGCELADAKIYLLGALGHIALTLDQFPMERFLLMVKSSCTRLDAAICAA